MSDDVWTPLTIDTAPHFAGTQIEARRDGGEIERHPTGVVYRSMGLHWLQIGHDLSLRAWSNGLAIDGLWMVRRTEAALHEDAQAFVGAL